MSVEIQKHISNWLLEYCQNANMNGFIVGISGGIDSAVTSTLCALTGKKTVLVNMPIRQSKSEYDRGTEHINDLLERFGNCSKIEVNLTPIFESMEANFPVDVVANQLSMANTRARLRMTTLYAIAQQHGVLVAGTGNKIEDFGVGFFTKYGDGGVDISPIADLTKTDVRNLAKELNVVASIQLAKPTDGLWGDDRTDEDQLGATYPELEWAMEFNGDESNLSTRQLEVLSIYRKLNRQNKHKMEPIPVCLLPKT
ncbi:MAG: NAD(+) synthase [Crocinitomicaceae bacterium]|nr:NAD(+) synthase [Crocinitomicaceae bacterium]